MDVQTLAKEVVAFLAPFLPYLVKAGGEAAKEAGKKFGEAAWEQAKALWDKLRPKVEAKPAAHDAVQDAAAAPDDPDAQAALRLQLKKLLTEDETLTTELARLVQEGSQVMASTVIQQKAGDRAIQIGKTRDVHIEK
jgi:hypothetical protein